jgi:hypothetical protein
MRPQAEVQMVRIGGQHFADRQVRAVRPTELINRGQLKRLSRSPEQIGAIKVARNLLGERWN